MDLLYNRIVLSNRIILYNRTIRSLVLLIFTGVTFGVFDSSCVEGTGYWPVFHGECAVKMKYKLKFYLSSASTLVNFIQIL